jgi:hypothetical protein
MFNLHVLQGMGTKIHAEKDVAKVTAQLLMHGSNTIKHPSQYFVFNEMYIVLNNKMVNE